MTGMPREYTTTPQMCLRCGHVVDRASSAEGKNRAPQAGDITICIRCGHVMAFDQALKLRELTFKEHEEVDDDPRLARARFVQSLAAAWLKKGKP